MCLNSYVNVNPVDEEFLSRSKTDSILFFFIYYLLKIVGSRNTLVYVKYCM